MQYKRLTDKDLIKNININQNQDLTPMVVMVQRLWELENQIDSGMIGSLNCFKKVFTETVAQYIPYAHFNDRKDIESFIESCFERARKEL